MFLYILAGLVAGAIGGLLLLPKGACSDGSCPFTSGKFGGIFLGGMIGLALGIIAYTQFGANKPDKSPASKQLSAATSESEQENSLLMHVGTDGFKAAVSKGTVLVDFFATWCGPCKAQTPILEKFADRYQDTLKVIKVNIDESPEIAREFGVSGVPALVFFHNGKLLGGDMGLKQDAELEAMYQRVKEMISAPAGADTTTTNAATNNPGNSKESDA